MSTEFKNIRQFTIKNNEISIALTKNKQDLKAENNKILIEEIKEELNNLRDEL